MPHRVLIVDDNAINLVLFNAIVRKLGNASAHCEAEAPKGLAWAQQNEADVVIVDFMMPDLNGLEFIERLRATPGRETVPILMITANDQKEVRYRALQSGASDFLTKPVDQVEFSVRVANLLALGDAQRQLARRAEWLNAEVHKATAQILQRELETVIRLSKAAEYRDPETGAHILRMAHYSQLIARGLGLAEAEQELLLQAAPLHDIGKVGIADAILLKPGKLTPEEFEVMKMHAVYGHEILKDSSSDILQAGASIALGHHEKFNGTGYPYGLAGEGIPVFSRIVAVADVFDALTSVRPYKRAWTLDEARALIHGESGRHFDPRCVDVFFDHWAEVLEIRQRFRDEDEAWPAMLGAG